VGRFRILTSPQRKKPPSRRGGGRLSFRHEKKRKKKRLRLCFYRKERVAGGKREWRRKAKGIDVRGSGREEKPQMSEKTNPRRRWNGRGSNQSLRRHRKEEMPAAGRGKRRYYERRCGGSKERQFDNERMRKGENSYGKKRRLSKEGEGEMNYLIAN